MHITYILYIEILKFLSQQLSRVVASPSISLSGIYFLTLLMVMTMVFVGTIYYRGGEEGAPAALLLWLEASNVFFRRLYT